MELVHPTKLESRKKATAAQQRALIGDVKKLCPFAIQNVSATEHNLDVLYNNEEIKILLNKVVSERDALVAKRKEILETPKFGCAVVHYPLSTLHLPLTCF